MPKCQIQWVNEQGVPTPDTNEAVGVVWTVAHTFHFPHGAHRFEGDATRRPICAEHAKHLNAPGMEHWRFAPLAATAEKQSG